jgi:hypothetical protein
LQDPLHDAASYLFLVCRFHFVKAGDANLRAAVGYLEQSVAMILNENRDEAFFGWVRLAERQAGGVDFEEGTVQVIYNIQSGA